MAKQRVIPRVEDESTDRAIRAVDEVVKGLAESPMASGELIEVKPTRDGILKVPHQLDRKPVGALVVGSDKGVFSVTLLKSVGKVAHLGFSREWELLDRKDVAVDSTSFNFDYTADHGTDSDYRVDGYWKYEGSAVGIYWRVDETRALSDDRSVRRYKGNTTGTVADSMLMAYTNAAETEHHRFESKLFAQDDDKRTCQTVDAVYVEADGETDASVDGSYTASGWDEATNFKLLGVESDTSDAITAGSHFTLYRRPRLAGRTLKIWIF